ncbi:hypothetical protein [Thermoleptolyngbya sp.]
MSGNKKPPQGKKSKRHFSGMSYVEVQRVNSENRKKLSRDKQLWLKENNYRNIGWENVIQLYQKIEELLDKAKFEDMSLEELFLEADRIGNKYLSPDEIADFNQKMVKEAIEIGELIDQHFPDTEFEIIDFRDQGRRPSPRKPNQKTYRTTQL